MGPADSPAAPSTWPDPERLWGAPGLSPLSLSSAWPNADAERHVCELLGEKAE